ncbi:uncharacterized protein PHACADRAFT_248899 [Phanerochaete carnosa HHB-10118-sp]|uniref:Secreted protein n=1 Tax=Phanerochaete carnosa (strain HHB-10118-sp) TaxID=650164 RepID=K5X7L1_PHACS|nr:uncharacterized protein PHACADRAFT_248899 [Phanerochaete carnosa HHB-10118-sp]EKM58817.1 hypothetical protein PHACADRAFT_248899 [Phanerochaete carnosa HHB-10118-sp]
MVSPSVGIFSSSLSLFVLASLRERWMGVETLSVLESRLQQRISFIELAIATSLSHRCNCILFIGISDICTDAIGSTCLVAADLLDTVIAGRCHRVRGSRRLSIHGSPCPIHQQHHARSMKPRTTMVMLSMECRPRHAHPRELICPCEPRHGGRTEWGSNALVDMSM